MAPKNLASQFDAYVRSCSARNVKDDSGRCWKLSMIKSEQAEWDVVIEPVASSESTDSYSLTRREREIAHWLCEGKSNPEMGQILGISRKTVEKHVENIFGKLGVSTRSGAVRHILQDLPGESKTGF